MKHLIPAFLAFLTLQAGAQNVKLNSGGDWTVPGKDGVLELTGRMRKITSEQLQKVDPAARYTLTWEARGNVPEEAGKYMIGFSVYDKDGQEIQPYHVYYTPGSETVLTEDAPKGGRTLKIRDGSKWKSGAMYCPAFHVKADGGDIPNRDVLTGGIEKVTAGDGYTELTLKRPLAKDYPAGTAVRQHLYQSSLYLKVADIPAGWKKESAALSGISKGAVRYGQWWPGTEYFRVMITGNIGSRNADAEMNVKNIELDVKGAGSIF